MLWPGVPVLSWEHPWETFDDFLEFRGVTFASVSSYILLRVSHSNPALSRTARTWEG